jgi:hypothetical protein
MMGILLMGMDEAQHAL